MRSHSSSNRLEYIEISRGIAALLVVCFHATSLMGLPKYFGTPPLGGLFSFGYSGVDFFFVLSGFVIFYSTSSSHGNVSEIPSYIKRRLIRIYPIYWIVGLALLPLVYYMGYRVGAANAAVDFMLIPRAGSPFVAVAWSLRNEMLFYLLFVLFFLNAPLAWVYFLLWGAALVAGCFFTFNFDSPLGALFMNDHNLEFMAGIYIARFHAGNRLSAFNAALLLCMGVILFTGAGLYSSLINTGIAAAYSHYHLLFGIAAALIISGLACLKADAERPWIRVGSFFGRASYAVYLVHFAVLSAAVKLLLPLGLAPWLTMLLLVIAGVLSGSLLHQYVEAPLLARIRKKVLKGR